jgi:hypothetical protein
MFFFNDSGSSIVSVLMASSVLGPGILPETGT